MGLPNGVHHLAICTKDIKQQIESFTQVVRGWNSRRCTGCTTSRTRSTAS